TGRMTLKPETAKAKLKALLKRWLKKQEMPQTPPFSLEEKYSALMKNIRRDLLIWRDIGKARSIDVIFALQPFATFLRKKMSPEEERLFEILDGLQGSTWRELKETTQSFEAPYQRDLEDYACELGLPYINLNKNKEFCRDQWLFVDRIHLTDSGYEVAAE